MSANVYTAQFNMWFQSHVGKEVIGNGIDSSPIRGIVQGWYYHIDRGLLVQVGDPKNPVMGASNRLTYHIPDGFRVAYFGALCHREELDVYIKSGIEQWFDKNVGKQVRYSGKSVQGTVVGWLETSEILVSIKGQNPINAEDRKNWHVPDYIPPEVATHGLILPVTQLSVIDNDSTEITTPSKQEVLDWFDDNVGKMVSGTSCTGAKLQGKVTGWSHDAVRGFTIFVSTENFLLTEDKYEQFHIPKRFWGTVRTGYRCYHRDLKVCAEMTLPGDHVFRVEVERIKKEKEELLGYQKPVSDVLKELKYAQKKDKELESLRPRLTPIYRYQALYQAYNFLSVFNESYESRETQIEYQTIMHNRFNPGFNPERILRFLCQLDGSRQPPNMRDYLCIARGGLLAEMNPTKWRK